MGQRGLKNSTFDKVLTQPEIEWLAAVINSEGFLTTQRNVFISGNVVYQTIFPIYKYQGIHPDQVETVLQLSELTGKSYSVNPKYYDLTIVSEQLRKIMLQIWDELDEDRQEEYMAALAKAVTKQKVCDCDHGIN